MGGSHGGTLRVSMHEVAVVFTFQETEMLFHQHISVLYSQWMQPQAYRLLSPASSQDVVLHLISFTHVTRITFRLMIIILPFVLAHLTSILVGIEVDHASKVDCPFVIPFTCTQCSNNAHLSSMSEVKHDVVCSQMQISAALRLREAEPGNELTLLQTVLSSAKFHGLVSTKLVLRNHPACYFVFVIFFFYLCVCVCGRGGDLLSVRQCC